MAITHTDGSEPKSPEGPLVVVQDIVEGRIEAGTVEEAGTAALGQMTGLGQVEMVEDTFW